MEIKKSISIVGAIWLLLIAASFGWNYTSARQAQKKIALFAARSFFDQIVIARKWNAGHGGVYVPITEDNRPNPYLDIPLRDIDVNDQLKLTKINPAYMTRQLAEIAMRQDGIQFHITSLKPIRPQNKPTDREEKLLKEFENGTKETGFLIKDGGENYFFYMAPLITENSCLSCHAKQGYSAGEVRGGISVTLPFSMDGPIFALLFAHLGIGLLGLIGIVFSVTKLSNAYKEVQQQAVFDALTGIPNRRNFSESLLRENKRSRRLQLPLSVIMCDIDNFKTYNDTYGHDEGDNCLKQVAKKIEQSLDRPGDFCARYGGEEFVIILPNTTLEGAQHIAEKIRLAVENMKIPNERSLPFQTITLSLGIATSYETDEIPAEDLMKYADKALYRAKEKGKNRVESCSDIYSE